MSNVGGFQYRLRRLRDSSGRFVSRNSGVGGRLFNSAVAAGIGAVGSAINGYASRRHSTASAPTLDSYHGYTNRTRSYHGYGHGASKYGGALIKPSHIVGGTMKKRKTFKRKSKKRMSKRGKIQKKIMKKVRSDSALKNGYHITNQTFGLAQDSDAVYITHSTWHWLAMTKCIIGAIVRKAFKKAGYPIENKNGRMTIYSEAPDSGRWRLSYCYQDQTTGAVTATSIIDTNAAWDFQQLVEALYAGDMGTNIKGLLLSTDKNIPYSFTLYQLDSGNQTSLASRIALAQETFVIPIESLVRMQNRTLPATATTGDIGPAYGDRTDAQPVKVKVIEFSSGTPRLKYAVPNLGTGPGYAQFTNIGLNIIQQNGLYIQSSLSLNANIKDYQEPVPSKLFANVAKTSSAVVDPGIIKYSSLKYVYKGSLANLAPKIRPMQSSGSDPNIIISGLKGKSEMIIIDEYLRTKSNNKIAVSYEKQVKVGCYLITKKPSVFTSELQTAEINVG